MTKVLQRTHRCPLMKFLAIISSPPPVKTPPEDRTNINSVVRISEPTRKLLEDTMLASHYPLTTVCSDFWVRMVVVLDEKTRLDIGCLYSGLFIPFYFFLFPSTPSRCNASQVSRNKVSRKSSTRTLYPNISSKSSLLSHRLVFNIKTTSL